LASKSKAVKSTSKKPHFTYIGSRDGIERELAKRAGIEYHAVSTGKLRRYFNLKNFTDLFRIPLGIFQAYSILGKSTPDLIFSKGGFVGAPVVWAGWARGIPVIIHESDAIPGLTTKITAPFAKKILFGYKEAADKLEGSKKTSCKCSSAIQVTGNPVRQKILKGSAARAKKLTGFKGKKPVLLVMGGSKGAQQINQIVKEEKAQLTKTFDIVHLTGQGKKKKSPGYFSAPYLHEEMKDIYALASLALSRAGANSLAELEALKAPTLLYPLGLASSRGDQVANAKASATAHPKLFKIADPNKSAHAQLLKMPKRKKVALKKSQIIAAQKIAKILTHATK